MHDNELRERFSEWARPLTATVPPPVSAIRRRSRGRVARIAGSCLATAALLGTGAFQASGQLDRGATSPFPATSGSPSSSHPGDHRPGQGAFYAAAPYYIAVGKDVAVATVWNAVTGTAVGTIDAPVEGPPGGRYPTFFGSIAAAGDDRTFVLAALPNVYGTNKVRPVWLFEVRLAANGLPGRPKLLTFAHEKQGRVGRWFQSLASIALSADGTKLAIATNHGTPESTGPPNLEVVTLATGATRTWTASPQAIGSLSWAKDRIIAFACDGVCLLDTAAPGRRLTKADILIHWPIRYRGLQSLQWPMITPDGSAIYVTMEGGGLAIVEFSASTGRPLRVVLGPRPLDGTLCGTLWSGSAGRRLIATCTWGNATGMITDGRFEWGPDLPPARLASNESGDGGSVIGW